MSLWVSWRVEREVFGWYHLIFVGGKAAALRFMDVFSFGGFWKGMPSVLLSWIYTRMM